MDSSQIGSALAGGPPATAAAKGPAVSSDFETFLRMLATQLQNQDPLNPVESTDYAVQLATFSSVEQQVLTNELLRGLAARQTVTGMGGMAGWIGLEARSAAPARFDGATPVELAPNPLVAADKAVLLVRAPGGATLAEIPIPVSAEPYFWDGRDAEGKRLPPGRYGFALENYQNGELLATDPLETYARVTEARNENGEIMVVLDGETLIPSAEVTALRDPGTPLQ